jgi:sugar diacid utilization regulator
MAFPATIAQMISPKLTKLALCASVSLKQPSYEFLAAAMHHAEMALQLGRKKTMDQQIYTFKEVYAEYIIQVLSKDQDTYSLCHPIVQKIVKNHDQWSLELIHTLWIYLQNGKRISQTADKLFIHRNTLVNRLQSIEKILEIDFETIDDEDLDMLLISCFIVKTKHRLL